MSYERSLSILAETRDAVSKDGRKLMINIDRRLVQETPRDTGSAKASWLASVNQPDESIVNINGDGSESMAITTAIGQINLFQCGDTLYLQNNQPYIERLNDGWSEQAPSGFVDAIIAQELARSDR